MGYKILLSKNRKLKSIVLFYWKQTAIPCQLINVTGCPKTEEKWQIASQTKNCSLKGCTEVKLYHCVPTETGQLVEVCTSPINLQGQLNYTFEFLPAKINRKVDYTHSDGWNVRSLSIDNMFMWDKNTLKTTNLKTFSEIKIW